MAFLNLVTEENYNQAKQGGSVKYGSMFGADYSSFNESRRKFFNENRYNLSVKDSREVYRSYLSDAQIAAWSDCKRAAAQPIVRYQRTGDEVTGVEIEWSPHEPLGTLFLDEKVMIFNAVDQPTLKELNGKRGFTLRHADPSKPIAGSINGHTGEKWFWLFKSNNWRDRTVYVYVPARPRLGPEAGPKKFVVPIPKGQVKTSWAYWQGRAWPAEPKSGEIFRTSWECISAPVNMTLVVVGDLVPRHLGARKGYCVQGAEYCTHSGAEYCTDLTIEEGCYVNTNWVDWYDMTMRRLGMRRSNEQMCQPED
ncbi:hypothetical protein ACNFH5_30275 [Pseudomonas sp. NY15435]|uniref:hypothetical protein n=1 Tax=Pseudomonas sp. NY15435 TaxID=3400358 RepID=UPI003A8C72BF